MFLEFCTFYITLKPEGPIHRFHMGGGVYRNGSCSEILFILHVFHFSAYIKRYSWAGDGSVDLSCKIGKQSQVGSESATLPDTQSSALSLMVSYHCLIDVSFLIHTSSTFTQIPAAISWEKSGNSFHNYSAIMSPSYIVFYLQTCKYFLYWYLFLEI